MKNKLLNNYNSLRLLVLLFILANTFNTEAQIIYTDIEPDFTGENLDDSYNLDLNNDGIVDFNIELATNSVDWIWIRSSQENGINGCLSINPYWENHPIPLDIGKEISSSSYNYSQYFTPWSLFIFGDCLGGEETCFYDWKSKNDKYLGLRFLINGQTHYGWARLDLTSHTQWIIKDYAYNATPNEKLLAGQMTLGVEESNLKEIKIVVSNKQITILNLQNHTKYNLFSINGQKTGNGTLNEINNKIDVQNLVSGLYFIDLRSNNANSSIKRKIIIL